MPDVTLTGSKKGGQMRRDTASAVVLALVAVLALWLSVLQKKEANPLPPPCPDFGQVQTVRLNPDKCELPYVREAITDRVPEGWKAEYTDVSIDVTRYASAGQQITTRELTLTQATEAATQSP